MVLPKRRMRESFHYLDDGVSEIGQLDFAWLNDSKLKVKNSREKNIIILYFGNKKWVFSSTYSEVLRVWEKILEWLFPTLKFI